MDQKSTQAMQEPFQPYQDFQYPNDSYPNMQQINFIEYPIYQPNQMQYNPNYIPSAGIPINQLYIVEEKQNNIQDRLNMIGQQLITHFTCYYFLLWLMVIWSFLLIILWIVLLVLVNLLEDPNIIHDEEYRDFTPVFNIFLGVFLALAIYNLAIFLIGLISYRKFLISLNYAFKGFLLVTIAFEVCIICYSIAFLFIFIYNIVYMIIICCILYYCTRYGNLLNEKQRLESIVNVNMN